jgi:hypothetical protein
MFQKSCSENQNTRFMFSNFLPKFCAVYEIISKNLVVPEATNDVTIWRKYVACWISKTTLKHAHARAHAPRHSHTHVRTRTHTDKYNTYCFSTATMIRESASLLRYTYIVVLFIRNVCFHVSEGRNKSHSVWL